MAAAAINRHQCDARKKMFLRVYAREPQSIRGCALQIGLNDRTVRRWLSQDVEFKAAVLEIFVKWHIEAWRETKDKVRRHLTSEIRLVFDDEKELEAATREQQRREKAKRQAQPQAQSEAERQTKPAP